MADYASIIKGTVNAVAKKAKDITESGAIRDAYDRGSTTAKCYANIAKLNLQINGELEEQKKLFTEIGKIYYEQNRDTPEGFFIELFEKLREKDDKIDALRSELEAAKQAVAAAKENKNVEVEIVDYEE